MRARRVVVLPYAAEDMFAVADGIEHYPAFLPWCDKAEVKREAAAADDSQKVWARLHIRYFALDTSFATENTHRRPRQITMSLAEGPLSSLRGEWRFAAAGEGRCRASFDLEYQFGNRAMAAVFGKMFEAFFGKFADCFAARAEELYGANGCAKFVNVEVAGAGADGEYWSREVRLQKGATAADALKEAGAQWPREGRAGIWGRQCEPQTLLQNGDRVEIYAPLVSEPRSARRIRARKSR